MKFWVEFTRTEEWGEEVEVPEELLFFRDDDHMERGLVPASEAKVAQWLREYGKSTSAVPESDEITVDFGAVV